MLKVLPGRRLMLYLILAFLVFAMWAAYLQVTPQKNTTWNYLFNVGEAFFYFFAAAVAWWRWRSTRPHSSGRYALQCFALAAALWGLAYVVWAYYNLILEQSVPYPSVADVFFLPAYPLLGMAIWNLHETYQSKTSPRVSHESVLIVLISAVVIMAFLNRPDLSPDLGLSKNLLNVAYSLGDVILVAGALIELRIGDATKYRVLITVILFLLLQAGADFMFAYRNNAGHYWNGDIADFLFGVSGWLFALSMTQNSLINRSNTRK